MRTKHIFTAMVLPALFAACTADEFVENGGNVNLADRALLDPFTITLESDGADTRFAWDEEAAAGVGNWTWESTDAFSAFLVNDGTGKPETWTPTNNLLTNYIYKSEDGVSYTTTSALVEGLYWYYAPARTSEGVGSTKMMTFDLATAQSEDYWKSEDAQMFITGLYKLVAGDKVENLPLVLTNYYARAVFPLTNNTDGAIEIKQIVLENENGTFEVKGNIATANLKDYMYAFDEAGELVSTRNLDKDTENDETNAELRNRLAEADLVSNDDDLVTTSVLVLNLDEGVVLEKGASKTFTMLVPRTNKNTTCSIRIITDKGMAEIESTDNSNYAKNVQFKHNGVMPMFGLASDKSFKAYSIEKLTETENMYYVGSYDDMIALINTVNGKFSVYNMGDWKVDADMADALENSDSYVSFLQPITIKDEENEVKLTKVSFGETNDEGNVVTMNTVTVAKGTKVSFNATEKSSATVKNAVVGVLNIEEGAEVVLNSGDFKDADIKNAGTLTVNDGAEFPYASTTKNPEHVIASTGVLKIVGNNGVAVEINGGSLEYAAKDATAAGAVTYTTDFKRLSLPDADDLKENESDVTVTVGKNVTLNVKGSRVANVYEDPTTKVVYRTNIVNNGTLSVSGTLTANGDLTNNGIINGNGKLTINGTATNAADAEIAVKSTTGKNAKVTNSGEMSNITNNGAITTAAQSRTNITDGEGVINNTAKAYVGGTLTNQKITYEITTAMNAKALNDLNMTNLASTYKINALVVKSALNIDSEDFKGGIPAEIGTIDFETGSSVYVNAEAGTTGLTIAHANVNINGNVTFGGFDKTKSNYVFTDVTKSSVITVAKNCTLTIKNCKVTGNITNVLQFKMAEPEEGDPEETEAGKVVKEDNAEVKNCNGLDN